MPNSAPSITVFDAPFQLETDRASFEVTIHHDPLRNSFTVEAMITEEGIGVSYQLSGEAMEKVIEQYLVNQLIRGLSGEISRYQKCLFID